MITPKDIEKQQFEVTFRGYSSREVDEFLNRMATEISEMLSTEEQLRKKIAAAELIAKDAKDHEEEFIASMAADREEATAILEAARTEGEKIIKDAKRAASGIMAEVRRRASEISAESRRSVDEMEGEAQRRASDIISAAEASAAETIAATTAQAEELIAAAKAEAERLLLTARTEADNTVKAAELHARTVVSDAKAESDALIGQANSAATLCEEYMNRIREEAKLLCLELDTELRNSAARISVLGRRIAEAPEPAPAPVTDIRGTSPAASPAPVTADATSAEDVTPATPVPPVTPVAADEEAAPAPITPVSDEEADASDSYDVTDSYDFGTNGNILASAGSDKPSSPVPPAPSSGGYFTEEYRRVMEELFGEGVDLSGSSSGDDDTYDYLDRVSDGSASATDDDIDTAISFRRVSAGDSDGDGDYVSAEYGGLSGEGDDALDIFSSTVDKVYKAPSEDDITDIMSNF